VHKCADEQADEDTGGEAGEEIERGGQWRGFLDFLEAGAG
jgi:hypothetical protein